MSKPIQPKDTPLQVNVVDGVMTISIGVSTLAYCSKPENGGPLEGCKVDQRRATQWAKDVAYELDNESEDGNSMITRLLDKAMVAASENGSAALIFPKRRRSKK